VTETVELLAPSGVALRMLDHAAVEPPTLGQSIVDEAFRSGVDVAETARRSGGCQVLGYGEGVDFYYYGFASRDALDRVRDALGGLR
jgi:hypothetical protein